MAEIFLQPLDGGENILIPEAKTTIGRGPFLQVQDKRVSRNHATIEIKNEKLVLIPIHTNPCFYKEKGSESQVALSKDQEKELGDSDVFGLLPDKLFYKVLYKNTDEKSTNNTEKKKAECSDTEEDNEEDSKTNHKEKPKQVMLAKGGSDKEIALPLEKKRELPKWMIGSSKRVDSSPEKSEKPEKKKDTSTNGNKVETPAKSRSRGKPKKSTASDDDSDDTESRTASREGSRQTPKKSYRELSDDDDYEEDHSDYEEKSPRRSAGTGRGRGRGRGRGKGRGRGRGRTTPRRRTDADSDGEEDDEDEDMTPKKPARRPRAASLKSPGYNDDFALSDEEFHHSDSDVDSSSRKRRNDSDSDFNPADIVEDDAGQKNKSPAVTKGRARGRGRRSFSPSNKRGRGRPPVIRASRKRKSYSDDDFEDTGDKYKPRPSKRRAAATKKKKVPTAALR